MAFERADFWVVMGTAAPVIALASAVTTRDVVLAAMRMRGQLKPSPTEAATDVVFRRYKWPWAFGATAFILDLIVTAVALVCLALRADSMVLAGSMLMFLVASFAFVGLQAIATAAADGRSEL